MSYYICGVCDLAIEGYDIENRHSLDNGEDCHAGCCPTCEIVCEVCDAHLFVADIEFGQAVWSHVEDTGCDDPCPTHHNKGEHQ